MKKRAKIEDIKKKFKVRNALNIVQLEQDAHHNKEGKFRKLKVNRYYFDRHVDIISLWSVIIMSGVAFLVVTLLSPLNGWIKAIIITVTLTISLVMVLLSHEQLILINRLNFLINKLNLLLKKYNKK